MNYLYILIAMASFIFMGCAKQTIHDYCMEHIEHYNTYEECYQSTAQSHANVGGGWRALGAVGHVMSSAGQGLQNAPRPVRCTPDLVGGYNCQ